MLKMIFDFLTMLYQNKIFKIYKKKCQMKKIIKKNYVNNKKINL